MQAVTLNKLEEMIRLEYRKVPPERVYFTMKKMKVKRIRSETVETMRFSLALHKLGIFVTTHLIASLRGISEIEALRLLHRLGDVKCLTLLRDGKGGTANRWVVSSVFLESYGWEDHPR